MPVTLTLAATNAALRDRAMGRVPLTGPPAFPPHLADFAAIEAHSMLELEPPRHTRLRGLVLRAFTQRRIATLAPEIEALCHSLIDALPAGAPVDLLTAYAQRVPVLVIARLIGIPDDMADQLLAWSHAMVAMYQAGRSRADEDRANAAARAFAAYLRTHIEARRTRPAKDATDDLLTHLIAARDEGRVERLGQTNAATFDQGARVFGPQERSELFLSHAAAETVARFAKARVFEHFGKETGLKFLCDIPQGGGLIDVLTLLQ
jgi:unspecific monooxygenase